MGETKQQTQCLNQLAWLLFSDKQLDAAEDAASRTITLITEKGQEYTVCQLHHVLGRIHHTKGEKKKAIRHFEAVLRIASPFDWHGIQFWAHCSLAELFSGEHEFDDAHAHVKRAKPHAVNDAYKLGRATHTQAIVWYRQRRLEDSKSEASHALKIFENLGAVKEAGACRGLLQTVERAMENRSTSSQGELLETILHPTPVNFHFPV